MTGYRQRDGLHFGAPVRDGLAGAATSNPAAPAGVGSSVAVKLVNCLHIPAWPDGKQVVGPEGASTIRSKP